MRNKDYQLYLVTDRDLMSTDTLEDGVLQAIKGGVTMVQLREKDLNSRQFLEEALAVKKITDKYNIPLIINDRLDIALAIDADGVHVGQNDLPVDQAKRLLGQKIVGASVQTVAEALEAQEQGADYLGVGTMYPTNTKKDAVFVSKKTLQEIIDAVSIPIVLIGGINQKTIPEFKDYHVQGFAIVSAIIAAEDIQKTSKDTLKLIQKVIKE